ncbi:MAG: isoaspartyl peptidase/L-asparaginase family protein [Kofleriaceae bacterium]
MDPAIVVHAGAGLVAPERHARLRAACREAAAAGHAILAAGGTALDAAVAAVRVLEDNPETNAGRGSVLTREQTIETDAAVMDGASQRVGAVAAVPSFGQAIALARAVLDEGEHAILAGAPALALAIERGLSPEPAGSLVTERAYRRWCEEAVKRGAIDPEDVDVILRAQREKEGGTVGAVARDREGRFAAATSTGGINYKRSGRVGDSPIPGAGTWADARCAISATGDGEAILRVALAHSIAMHARHGAPLDRAVRDALGELRAITHGSAGVIAIDAGGRVFAQLSPTMPVGWVDAGGAGDSMGQPIAWPIE